MYTIKRFFAVIAILSLGLTANMFAAEGDDWKFDFNLYSRVVSASGTTLGKGESSGGYPNVFYFRFRPTFIMSKGGFSATLGTGSDIFFGSGEGPNFDPASLRGDLFAIRNANIKYKAENGFYVQGGIVLTYIPMYFSDGIGAINFGWSNDKIDAKVFYAVINSGGIVDPKDDGGIVGLQADVTIGDSFTITPLVLGVFQRSGVKADPRSYEGYAGGAMFVGGFGVLPGVAMSYNSDIGVFVNARVMGAFGKNEVNLEEAGLVKQTRSAVGGFIEAGYQLEGLLTTSLFFDFRSGDSNPTGGGTNSSFNGAVLEYDANTAPLLILYNDGIGKVVMAYGNHTPDGYAYSDKGVMAFGGTLNFKISDFSIGTNLGYALFASNSGGSKAMGFEVDVVTGYQIMENLKAVINFGLLVPGKGIKELITGKTRTPILLEVGMIYS